MKHMVVDAFLPEDIITNILKRLPVKSIIQIQCVCKRWKNLIKSPSFISQHLHHQKSSLLLQQVHRRNPLYLCLLSSNMQLHEVENSPFIDSLVGIRIIGSSNGLLCLADNHGGMLLWNPTIRDIRELPVTIDDFPGECYFGFGYSPIINDYKIVKFYVSDVVNRVEVYSLSMGSWKDVEFENLEGGVVPLTNATTVNGVMFWYGCQVVEERTVVGINLTISFDIALEVIKVIALPDLFSYSCKPTLHDNKFAIVDHRWPRNSKYSHIYLGVMEEEEGVGSSTEGWSSSKKYIHSSYPFRLYPETIWNGQIVCTVYGLPGLSNQIEHEVEHDPKKVGLYLFSITANDCKKFSIPKYGFRVDVFNHVESLVSVDNILIEEP